DIKMLVDDLKEASRKEYENHSQVFRPWGSYETLEMREGFQVKRIIVNPGKRLSLQLHHQRSEHWVVVNGVGTVTLGDNVFDLKENESTFVPVETKHRLENKTSSPLTIIEVQVGSYLGEDDIVRFDDDFGRA
ncbi:MAG: mannose-1-phosphate guanylyltransferase/mannose-6-phosphate isomerase, partial [Planctomycetota bacterium]